MEPHELHQLRHPKQHLPEILTAQENTARHLVADIHTATAKADRILLRPSWGIDHGQDEADLADTAADIITAAATILCIVGREKRGTLAEILLSSLHTRHITVEHPTAEIWPFHLSSILSVVTRNMVARGGPAAIELVLRWMTGDPTITLGSPAASIAADFCAADLVAQYPRLDTDLPAVPAVRDNDTTNGHRPDSLAVWVRKIARIVDPDGDANDPVLPVRQLSRDVRRHVQHEIAATAED